MKAGKKFWRSTFGPFLEFYFPAIATQIDQSQGYSFLDQELLAVTRKAESKKRRLDKLAKVYLEGSARDMAVDPRRNPKLPGQRFCLADDAISLPNLRSLRKADSQYRDFGRRQQRFPSKYI